MINNQNFASNNYYHSHNIYIYTIQKQSAKNRQREWTEALN